MSDRPMTTAGLQAKVSLRRAWFEAHPNQPIPEGRAEVERLFAAIEAEAAALSSTLEPDRQRAFDAVQALPDEAWTHNRAYVDPGMAVDAVLAALSTPPPSLAVRRVEQTTFAGGPHVPFDPIADSLVPRGTCDRPPTGWYCSLVAGHDGPCPTRVVWAVDVEIPNPDPLHVAEALDPEVEWIDAWEAGYAAALDGRRWMVAGLFLAALSGAIVGALVMVAVMALR